MKSILLLIGLVAIAASIALHGRFVADANRFELMSVPGAIGGDIFHKIPRLLRLDRRTGTVCEYIPAVRSELGLGWPAEVSDCVTGPVKAGLWFTR